MLRKTIEIATPGTRLSVAHRQLVIERPEQPKATLPIEDIGVLIVDDRRATYTHAVFVELLAAGATVMVTGPDHLPARHDAAARRPSRADRAPSRAGRRLRTGQEANLARAHRRETRAAGLRPRPFRERPERACRNGAARALGRSRQSRSAGRATLLAGACSARIFAATARPKAINAALNYGYAVVRAAAARAIVASGLIPSLGVFHKNRANPFCLADDLFEPYRPYVDWRVKLLTLESAEPPALDDRATRAALLSLFNETVLVGGRKTPLLLALQASAASLCRALTSDDRKLALPEGLPLAPDLFDEDGEG